MGRGSLRLGTPLQRIATGLVLVFLTAPVPADPHPAWQRYDLVADPLGWVLVVLGATELARHDDRFAPALGASWLAGAVSVPLWFPQLSHQLPPSGAWAASLPQLAACLLLARGVGLVAASQQPPDAWAAKRAGLLVWGLALVAVLPVLVLGGGLDGLAVPTQLLAAVVDLALVYVLLRLHRRPWLGGPGPLEVGPGPARPGTTQGRHSSTE